MLKFFSSWLFLLLFPGLVLADACVEPRAASYGDVTVDQVVGVYDGDTLTVSVNKWPALIGRAVGVRVAGVDTPEIRAKCPAEKALALEARGFARRALAAAQVIELRNLRRDKYFRILADVCLDGRSLADELIRHGLGVDYVGGAKSGWCR